jgi:hypothetical protein
VARFIDGSVQVDPLAFHLDHRTQSTMISRSKCRPLKSSCAEVSSVIAGR